jgi:hypothetical protein
MRQTTSEQHPGGGPWAKFPELIGKSRNCLRVKTYTLGIIGLDYSIDLIDRPRHDVGIALRLQARPIGGLLALPRSTVSRRCRNSMAR